ncbi:hypothetical protein [Roseomonas fluvialis]|uniref:Uncharacterized protein n=1 Tax=Roseomonas fluvialis TaxID=1750527 RepID=A0ABN6NZE4_9PROT|nr:hypothetical protein [Roseomonas fluvialis]BDG70887.1 hypothetical protein Rmf_08160 [Roseomonas fluvialis]
MSSEIDTLRTLLDSGRVKLGVHIRKMNSPGSPVYQSWENVWPAGLILAVSFAALKWGGAPLVALGVEQGGAWAGTIVLGVGCWWWMYRVMPRVKDGVFDRTAAFALQSPGHFDALWAKGVLSLYAKLPDGTERAATGRNSWRDFVTALDTELKAQT